MHHQSRMCNLMTISPVFPGSKAVRKYCGGPDDTIQTIQNLGALKQCGESVTGSRLLADRLHREISLVDVGRISIAALTSSDWSPYLRFLANMTEEDSSNSCCSTVDLDRVRQSCFGSTCEACVPLLVWHADKIVATAILNRGIQAPAHGDVQIQIVVDSEYRLRGIGRVVVCEIVLLARSLAIDELICRCSLGQSGLITFLRRCGFREGKEPDEFFASPSKDGVRMIRSINRLRDEMLPPTATHMRSLL